MQTRAQAKSAFYDYETNCLVIELIRGTTFSVPCDLVQGLRGAFPEEIAEVKLLPRGTALHWGKLDVDLSVAGLLAALFDSSAWMAEMGRKGGSSTSQAKAAAARRNGRKGGRPRKREEI